jgi:hypothetical protein
MDEPRRGMKRRVALGSIGAAMLGETSSEIIGDTDIKLAAWACEDVDKVTSDGYRVRVQYSRLAGHQMGS